MTELKASKAAGKSQLDKVMDQSADGRGKQAALRKGFRPTSEK